jgi:integrase
MSRRKRLTDAMVASLQPRVTRYTCADPELPCHYVRVQPSGAKTFAVVTGSGSKWHTIGPVGLYSIDDSRERARKIIRAAREGRATPDSFLAVADAWFEMHVVSKGLRSKNEITRFVARLKREWAGRDFITIKRGDLAKFLDKMEKQHGKRQADYALAVFRGMANWYAKRHDEYLSPIVRGMNRVDKASAKRARILDDDELRAVWKQAEANGVFGALIRMLLLTAQRRDKVASMRWADVSVDGTWTITSEAREKGNAGELVLPSAAVEVIRAQPRYDENEFVLAGRGKTHFNGYSKAKQAFDLKVAAAGHDLPQWQLHDLRRTARSLMSRAGIRPDVAERVLGHAILGVEGVYDRHSYRDEKAHALKALASLIGIIVSPVDNVVPLVAAS